MMGTKFRATKATNLHQFAAINFGELQYLLKFIARIVNDEEVLSGLMSNGFDHTLKYLCNSSLKIVRAVEHGDQRLWSQIICGMVAENKG